MPSPTEKRQCVSESLWGTMIAKFKLDDTRRLVSCYTKGPCALEVGTRVTLTRDFDFGEGTILRAGEEGVVTFAGFYAHARAWVEVLLFTLHRGLLLDDNKIILEPFVTEDILSYLFVT